MPPKRKGVRGGKRGRTEEAVGAEGGGSVESVDAHNTEGRRSLRTRPTATLSPVEDETVLSDPDSEKQGPAKKARSGKKEDKEGASPSKALPESKPKPPKAKVDFAEYKGGDDTWKIITWNVNSLRACLTKGFETYVTREDPDVLVLQETKLNEDKRGILRQFPHQYWNHSKEKKGYSGTAVFSKVKPNHVRFGMGIPKHDRFGRLITLEFDSFFLVNTYVPNAGQRLENLDYRVGEWDKDLLAFLKQLEVTKPVVWTGDLNVAHQEIDIHNPKGNERSAGFTKEERESFSHLLDSGFVDSFRHLYPNQARFYTYWSYRFQAKNLDKGWRLDYYVVSQSIIDKVKDVFRRRSEDGSDHCPLGLLLQKF